MPQPMNVMMLGIFPWNYPSLSDTVRSMVQAMPANNLIYINPQAEERLFTLSWQERSDQKIRFWNPPYSFLPTRFGLHRLREKLSSRALRSDVRRMLGGDWRDNTVLYVTASTLEQSYEFAKALQPKHLLVDILDDNLGFPNLTEAKRESLKQMFVEIAEQANCITAVSQYLVNQTADWTGRSVKYLPNGVDVDRFRTVPKDEEPHDLQPIRGPRATFVGAITSWIDLRLIEQAALRLSDVQFVMVGPIFEKEADGVRLRRLQEMSNVHFLGAKPYEEVPRYLHASDVLLLPRTCDPYSLACDPLKVYEYLATGKPAVSTAHPSVERFAEFMYIGHDDKSFIDGIHRALQRNTATVEKQQRIIDTLSWKVRATKLLQGHLLQENA